MTIGIIAAGLAVMTGIGAGIGIGIATGKASEAIARQPEASGKINSTLLLGCALAEGTAIFGFITALIIIFKGAFPMLDFQLSTIVFTIINLLVLYLFLKKFLFGRVNAVLKQREKLIQEQVEAAAAGNTQAQALQDQYEQKLSGAREEAEKIVSDAKVRAQKAYDDQMAQAQAEAKRVQAEAEARIATQRQEMLRGVRQEVAQLAVLAASQVARKDLDRETDRAMVEEFLSEAGERT